MNWTSIFLNIMIAYFIYRLSYRIGRISAINETIETLERVREETHKIVKDLKIQNQEILKELNINDEEEQK